MEMILQPMDLLWTSLEEWLNLLRTEIDRQNQLPGKALKDAPKEGSIQDPPPRELSLTESMLTVCVSQQLRQEPRAASPELVQVLQSTSESSAPAATTTTQPRETLDPAGQAAAADPSSPQNGLSLAISVERDRLLGSVTIPEVDSPSSPGASIRRVASERLSWGSGNAADNDDVVGAIAPRICAVIQAFYMCCACQTQQK